MLIFAMNFLRITFSPLDKIHTISTVRTTCALPGIAMNFENPYQSNSTEDSENHPLGKSKLSLISLAVCSFFGSICLLAQLHIHSLLYSAIVFLMVAIGPLQLLGHTYLKTAPIGLCVGGICMATWIIAYRHKSIPTWVVVPPIIIWTLIGTMTAFWVLAASV